MEMKPEVGDWVVHDHEVVTVIEINDLRFTGERNSTTYYKLSKSHRGIEHNVCGGFRFPCATYVGDRLRDWQEEQERKSASKWMVGKTIASVSVVDEYGDITVEFTDGTTLDIGVKYGQDLPTLTMVKWVKLIEPEYLVNPERPGYRKVSY